MNFIGGNTRHGRNTNDTNRGWNGKIGSAEQGNDSFTWMAEGIDDAGKKVVRKGTVVIVR